MSRETYLKSVAFAKFLQEGYNLKVSPTYSFMPMIDRLLVGAEDRTAAAFLYIDYLDETVQAREIDPYSCTPLFRTKQCSSMGELIQFLVDCKVVKSNRATD
jgi:hypothetical protein